MASKQAPEIDHIYLNKNASQAPLAKRILRTLPGIPVTIVTNKNTFLRDIEKTPGGRADH